MQSLDAIRHDTGPLEIYKIIPELVHQLNILHSAIIQAAPGAGKSTVIPLALLHEPWLQHKKIILLEPRRLAARAIAFRLAALLHEKPGETVGYRMRFDTCIGKNTRIEVVTESILTSILQNDPALEDYGLVIFDEFHERNLHTDLALTLTLETRRHLRPGLRIILMSATLDPGPLKALLGDATILQSEGRQFPVDIVYLPPEHAGESLEKSTASAIRHALHHDKGDILVFLPGAGEIQRTSRLLENLPENINVLPLYGDLPYPEQQMALLPASAGRRKVILSTSIAETSLTIEGVSIVIDAGFSRTQRYTPATGFSKLVTERVTIDAADQRAGRAGRTAPGKCYRLWSRLQHEHLQPFRKPEILEADLAPLLLDLARWGNSTVSAYKWLTPPPPPAVNSARELLTQLNAIDINGKITDDGRRMAGLPAHPRIAHMLTIALQKKSAPAGAGIAALLEEYNLKNKSSGTDINNHLEMLLYNNSNNQKGESRLLKSFRFWCRYLGVEADQKKPFNPADAGVLIAAAYPERIARKKDDAEDYRLNSGQTLRLSAQDPMNREKWLAVAGMKSGPDHATALLTAPLIPHALRDQFITKQIIKWDTESQAVIAREETLLGTHLVSVAALPDPEEETVIRVLTEVLKSEGRKLLNWDQSAVQLLYRIRSLKCWRPDEDWPVLSVDSLLADLTWLEPWLPGILKDDQLKKINLSDAIGAILSYEQSKLLSTLAPEKITVPSGSAIRLEYFHDGSPPVLAVRLQELFGSTQTPVINEGRIPVKLHLLSPAFRPVQVTQDLAGFWKNTYPEIRKELKRRYPRHAWPENPEQAEPVRGAKKRSR